MKHSLQILQRNCQSFNQSAPILSSCVAQISPFIIRLQESRCTPCLSGYTTYSDPTITYSSCGASSTPVGQAAVLICLDVAGRQLKVSEQCTENHEAVIVHIRLPDGKPLVVASVYYRPVSGSQTGIMYE